MKDTKYFTNISDVSSMNNSVYLEWSTMTYDNVTDFNNSTFGIQYWRTPHIIFLSLLLAAIVIGNFCVLFAIGLSETGRKTRMNFFIMHLAISDLSVGIFSVSVEMAEKVSVEWFAGNVMCKMVAFSRMLVIYASTYVLVSLSIDRFDAIARPMNFSRSAFRARMLIYSAWITSAFLSVPALFLFEIRYDKRAPGMPMCLTVHLETVEWQIYFTFVALALFFIPAIIITVCYSIIIIIICKKSRVDHDDNRDHSNGNAAKHGTVESRGIGVRHGKNGSVIQQAKIRTIKMTFIIIVVFMLCWCPYVVFNLITVYTKSKMMGEITALIQSMAHLNSAANPIIYGVFSTRICRNLRRLPAIDFLAKIFCRCNLKKTRYNTTRLSNTTSWNDQTCFTEGSVHSKSRRSVNNVRRTFSDSESTVLGSGRIGSNKMMTSQSSQQIFRKPFFICSPKDQTESKPRGYRRPSGMPLVNRCLSEEDNRLLQSVTTSSSSLRFGESQI